MTIDQRRSMASAFLEKLRSDDRVLLDWITMPKNDPAALGTFIAARLDLEGAPTAAELREMAAEMDAAMNVDNLDSNVPRHVGFIAAMQQLEELDSNVPRHVGFIAAMQQANQKAA